MTDAERMTCDLLVLGAGMAGLSAAARAAEAGAKVIVVEKAAEIIGESAKLLVTRGPESILAGECPPTPMYAVRKRSGQRSRHSERSRSRGLFSRLLGRSA